MSGRIAVIPARGGSRRIPRKNLRPFLGRPIIARVIATARASELFDAIIVSTDDEEIAAVAREAGAGTPFMRPASLADELTGTYEVLRHAVDWLDAAGRSPDAICCLYPTAVFVTADDLRAACAMLDKQETDCVFAAVPYAHPVQRALIDAGDGRMCPAYPEDFARRTQDLPQAWHDAGQFYWLRATRLGSDLGASLDHALPFRMARHRVQDIDTPEDWEHAERLYRIARAPE